MLSDTMLKALNDQINLELGSAHLYLSMAAHFEHESLRGFAAWMRAQSGEEQEHAMKLFDYVNRCGGRVTLGGIDAPPDKLGSPRDVFEKVLAHEKKVTTTIHRLYELALSEKDYATQMHLHWFINEQVEEEGTAGDILEFLKTIEGQKHLILGMDRRMAQRTAHK